MWIGIFPEISGVGGVQQVSRQMGAVLYEAARERNLTCELFGLNDAFGPCSFRQGEQRYEFTGFARNKTWLCLRLLLSAPRIDRLYLGHVNLAPLGWVLRRLNPRVRYWVVAHGVEVWQPLPLLRRFALRGARGIFSVSLATKTNLALAQRVPATRIAVLPPGLEPAFAQANCDAHVGLPQGPFLLTVGRLVASEPGKGVDSMISVLPELLKTVPNLFYVIVGDGDFRPELETRARESPARNHIIFFGKLTLEQLKYCYSRCDVFVMPSRQEGFGLVFLEAMALGKPVVAGCIGGATEIVKNGVTGFLVVPGDLKMLELHLTRLLQDEALRDAMGEAGRKQVAESYSFEGYRLKLKAILNEVE